MSDEIFDTRPAFKTNSELLIQWFLAPYLADWEYLTDSEPPLPVESPESPPPVLSPRLLPLNRPRISARKPKLKPAAVKPVPHRPTPILIVNSPSDYAEWNPDNGFCESITPTLTEMAYLTPPQTGKATSSTFEVRNVNQLTPSLAIVPSDIMYFLH
jgi:hypothetical protein